MEIIYHDFTIKKGDTLNFPFTYLKDNAFVNLSGYTNGLMQLRESELSIPVLTISGSSINLTNRDIGQIAIVKDIAIPSGQYYYDLQLTGTNLTSTILSGKFNVLPDFSY